MPASTWLELLTVLAGTGGAVAVSECSPLFVTVTPAAQGHGTAEVPVVGGFGVIFIKRTQHQTGCSSAFGCGLCCQPPSGCFVCIMVLGSRSVQTLQKRSRAELGDKAHLWLRSSRALQPLWDLLLSAQPWDLPALLRHGRWSGQAAVEGLPRKVTLEIPQQWLAPVFHLGCSSYGLSSWVLVCPADPWVLSSDIPVLAS